MNLICPRCKGTKSFRDIGCMIIICKDCKGKGHIEPEEDVVVTTEPEPEPEKPKQNARNRWREKNEGT